MSRKPSPVPVLEHVAPQAADKRLARGVSRQARRATVRGLAASVGADLPTDAWIPSYANQHEADKALAARIARALGAKEDEGEDE